MQTILAKLKNVGHYILETEARDVRIGCVLCQK